MTGDEGWGVKEEAWVGEGEQGKWGEREIWMKSVWVTGDKKWVNRY